MRSRFITIILSRFDDLILVNVIVMVIFVFFSGINLLDVYIGGAVFAHGADMNEVYTWEKSLSENISLLVDSRLFARVLFA